MAATTFRNTRFTKRDYECTNVVACEAEAAPDARWEECSPDVLAGLTHLWTERGVRFYGYL